MSDAGKTSTDDQAKATLAMPPAAKPKRLERVAKKLMPATAISVANNAKLPPDAPFKLKLKHFLYEKLTRKEYVLGGVLFVLLFGGALAAGIVNYVNAPSKPVANVAKPKAPATPTIVSPLTGLPVTLADSKRIVTGVMIENSDFARPQSGLRQAGVVFEGIAEAGITRFLALFQESKPTNIGPIRSVRPYFLQWDLGFDAPIAHVGGSPEALADINKWHAKNLDEFYNGAYYHRITSRFAPHNMYTSMANLNKLEKSKGWTSSSFTSFPRKKDAPSQHPNATSIDFAISSPDFYVHYNYDPTLNSYFRREGGAKHIDAETGKQLEPHVVIAIVVPYKLESDGYHSDYATIGSGKAYIFQDGTVTIGTWKKTAATSQLQFLDAQNQPIALNAGQTWITAVGLANEVSYQGPATPGTKP